MQIALSPDEIEAITREAEFTARRLRRRLGLPPHELADLRQDLLLDLVRRLPAFDPARGSLRAFAGLILRNEAGRISMRTMRERQAQGGGLLSLDAPTGGEELRPLHERFGEEAGLSAWHGQPVDACDRIETSHTAATACGRLTEAELRLCIALGRSSLRARDSSSRARRATAALRRVCQN